MLVLNKTLFSVCMYYQVIFKNILLQELTAKSQSELTKGKKDQVNKIVYTEEGNGKVRQ